MNSQSLSPKGALYEPKARLIYEWPGSSGDALSWLFRKPKIGSILYDTSTTG